MNFALINRICRHSYSLGLVLAVLTIALVPLHVMSVERGNIARTMPDRTVRVAVSDLPTAEIGDPIQLWRFNPGWMRPIGPATVTARDGEHWVLGYDPAAFAWAVGRQGTVVEVSGDRVDVNIGAENHLKQGDQLILYDERQQVGRLQVLAVHPGRATTRIIQLRGAVGANPDPQQVMGLTASEFTIPNQATRVAWPWVPWLEGLAIAVGLGLWLWSVVSPVPGEKIAEGAERVRVWARSRPEAAKRVAWVALGVPMCLVTFQIILWFWVTAPDNLLTDLNALDQYLPLIETSWIPARMPISAQARQILRDLPMFVASGALLVWAFAYLATNQNLLWKVLDVFRFRSEKTPIYVLFKWVPRGLFNWVLHLAVFYLFARNLFWFLRNNMTAAAGAGWPGMKVDFTSLTGGLESTLAMLTTMPTVGGIDDFFAVARYLTWSACIVGCLIGYGHTILSIVYKPNAIRWVDFTIVGWMTNLMCYGAWASAVFMVFPHPTGSDPAVVGGPLYYLQPTTELYLNVVYTLSIFNMGTKFGVMVDKGLVDQGYYSVVRHPSYTLEPLMFSVLYMNRVTLPFVALGLLAHPFMYWLRSERDDHFMGHANEDYGPYRERVRWKYFPGIW